MAQLRTYEWAGLALQSQLEIPELSLCQRVCTRPDIVLRLHPWSEYRPNLGAEPNQSYLQALKGGGLLLRAPGYAQFVVHLSGDIDVRVEEGAHDAALRAFVLGPVLAAVGYVRGWVSLHAGAVVVDGQAMLFCGDSGAGKSTLVAHLAARGHQVLCDDVCVVDTSNRRAAVLATDRSVKLWPDALRRIAHHLERLQAVRLTPPAASKSKMQFVPYAASTPPRVHSIYELSRSPSRSMLGLEALTGTRALEVLIQHSQRKRMIGVLDIQLEHLHRCAALERQVRIFRLELPDDFGRLSPALSALEAGWQTPQQVEHICNEKIQIHPMT